MFIEPPVARYIHEILFLRGCCRGREASFQACLPPCLLHRARKEESSPGCHLCAVFRSFPFPLFLSVVGRERCLLLHR